MVFHQCSPACDGCEGVCIYTPPGFLLLVRFHRPQQNQQSKAIKQAKQAPTVFVQK